MSVVEVDQSGRIDRTNKPTVLAMANGKEYSIRITASDKQEVLKTLRQRRPRWSTAHINIFAFSVLLFLLLKDHIEKLDLAIIDPEFTDHEPVIKNRVLTLCRKHGLRAYQDQLTFDNADSPESAGFGDKGLVVKLLLG